MGSGTALPGRLAFYQALLVRNFTLPGVALGWLGMWRLAWTAPTAFWLVFGVQLTNTILFTQVSVPDSEVFFIPGHAMFALFIGFGIETLAAGARALIARGHWQPSTRRVASAAGAVLLLATLVPFAALGFARNDRATDTAVGDFQQAIFAAVLDRRLGDHVLAGYTLPRAATPDRRIPVRTYWALSAGRPPVVTTRIAGVTLEAHEVGRGNWDRYLREVRPEPGGLFVEEFDLVLPSHLASGSHGLELGVVELGQSGPSVEWIPLGNVDLG